MTWLRRRPPSPALALVLLLFISLACNCKQSNQRRCESQCLTKWEKQAEEDDDETFGVKERDSLGSC
jgi:hypothetical protein